MFKKLLTSALFAGFGAGLIVALLQIFLAVPIILEAEEYESGRVMHFAGVAQPAQHTHNDSHADAAQPSQTTGDAAEAGAPVEGFDWSRNIQTFLATEMTYIGFALLLIAGMALATRSGYIVSARSGIIWGVAGFAAFSLAPAMGLPPELPGSFGAPLALRQAWWIGTVVATVAGLAAIGFGKNWTHWGVGTALLALPHLIGAPHTGGYGGVVPPELQGEFVGLTLGISATGWASLGALAGYFWAKESEQA